MPLASMTEMLSKAKAGGYAVGQFNINNLEFTQAILKAAQAEKSPVILGVSEGAAKYMGGFRLAVVMVGALMDEYKITVPVCIHLDHGSTFEKCMESLFAGFTSVMIDASHFPLDENIALTKRVVDIAHVLGASVEAELGRVGGQEDDLKVLEADASYAIPADCVRLAAETGVDALAPALGSVHGPYRGEPKLGFDRMKEIGEMIPQPLVLHGGTGIPPADVKRAISLGTAKVNVNTENQLSSAAKVREVLAANPDVYDPRKYLGPARDAIQATVQNLIREFGSSGKA